MTDTCSDAARAAMLLLERGWTKQEPAVNADGVRCASWKGDAVAWSLLGSVSGCSVSDRAKLLLLGKLSAVTRRLLGDLVTVNTSKEEAIRLLALCVEDGR